MTSLIYSLVKVPSSLQSLMTSWSLLITSWVLWFASCSYLWTIGVKAADSVKNCLIGALVSDLCS